MNATQMTADGRVVLRLERRISHPVEKVWRTITERDQLSLWYPFQVIAIDLTVGGKVSFDDGEGTIYHGEVRELDHHRVFSFTEVDDLIHIELQPEGDTSLLIFTHTFDDPSIAESNATGWNECLNALESLVGSVPSRD